MTAWVAFLRGVNVGGNNKVPMGKLRKSCEAAGWENVRSYVASGNLVFEAEGSAEGLAGELQAILKSDFGVSTWALVLSGADLRRITAARPVEPEEGRQLHGVLTLGEAMLDEDLIGKLKAPSETIVKGEGVVWLHTPEGFGRSRLAEKIDRVIKGTTGTARNLNTLRALVEMLDDIA